MGSSPGPSMRNQRFVPFIQTESVQHSRVTLAPRQMPPSNVERKVGPEYAGVYCHAYAASAAAGVALAKSGASLRGISASATNIAAVASAPMVHRLVFVVRVSIQPTSLRRGERPVLSLP